MLVSVYPPLEPARLAARRVTPAEFPFDSCHLTHLGRGAVWLVLGALGIGRGTKIAMPSYHCGSEVEAANLLGAEICFYRVNADLTVDLDHLAEVGAGCDLVYLISFFGFPTPIREALEIGPPVVEDAAHALFSLGSDGRPIGSGSQAAIFCPRKSLGVPDGGAFVGADVEVRGRPASRAMLRSIASLSLGWAASVRSRVVARPAARLMAGSSKTRRAAESGEMTDVVIGEWDLTTDDFRAAAAKPSRLTSYAVVRYKAESVRRARRDNYAAIVEHLADFVPSNFRELPDGTCPLYVPIVTRDRETALRVLWEADIRSIEVWPVPHPALDRREFSQPEAARRSMIALPCHQSMTDREVERVLEVASSALGG